VNTDEQNELNSLIQRRLEELEQLKAMNVEPYAFGFDVDAYSTDIKDNFEKYEGKDVKIAEELWQLEEWEKLRLHILGIQKERYNFIYARMK